VTEPIYSWNHGIYARSLGQIHLTLVDPGFPERYKAQICIRHVPYDLCLEDRPIVPFARLHVHVKSSSPKSVRYQEHSYAGSGWISFRPLLLVQQGFNVDSSRLTGSSVKGNLWPSGTILSPPIRPPGQRNRVHRNGRFPSGLRDHPEVRLPRSLGPRGYFRRHS